MKTLPWLAPGLLAGLLLAVPVGPASRAGPPVPRAERHLPPAGPASRAAPLSEPQRGDPSLAEDVQDILFFSETRPVLIRLHVFVDGKPHAARWQEHLTRWFRFLDRDDDGFLDQEEAARAPSVLAMQQTQSNPYSFFNNARPPFDEMDLNHDKKISPAEFIRYYRSSPAGPVQMVPLFNGFNPNAPAEDPLTEALFAALDINKDGRLSREELAAAETALHRYDVDDDELITVGELLPGGQPGLRFRPPPSVQRGQPQTTPLMLVQKDDAPRRIAHRLRLAKEVLAHYDKDKNQHLSRDEISMPRELFEQLDTSQDGELDAFELLRWVIVTPDAEAVLRLGKTDGKADLVEVLPCVATRDRKKPALRKVSSNALAFTTEDTCINLLRAPAVNALPNPALRQQLLQQFRNADREGKGFLTSKQLQAPQFAFLRNILSIADRDDDGKLTEKEMNAWIDLVSRGTGCQISVTLGTGGRGLFQILDANQDGRLSIRELRQAGARLAAYDRAGEGVTRKAIPYQYRVVVNRGGPNYAAAQPGAFGQPGQAPAPTANPRAPVWFRKMDRNGDGDVSAREFLGTPDAFRKLDTDGDGLISLDEALKADAALRKK